jgi:antitoxin component YwqK of YwqJK toxin-antitoxin module
MNSSLKVRLWIGALGILMLACGNNYSDQNSEDIKSSPGTSTDSPSAVFALETVEETDPDGNLLKFTRRDSDGLKEGVFNKTSAKGIKLEEARYKNGKLDGQRVLFYPNGDTLIVETYQEDLFDGPYKSFYPNGQLKMVCTYVDNNIEGKWLQYYESGQIKEEVLFQDNIENGPFREYHPNGQLSVEGSYKDGDNEHGPLKFYNEQGLHYKTMECNMGICRTVWSPEKNKENKGNAKKRK